jgi:hypothetical protein
MRHPWVAVWIVAALPLAGCFSGVKWVRAGEACVSGDQIFAGEVACADGFTCVPTQQSASGEHQGVCFPACVTDAVCAVGRVCATGACVPSCASGCMGSGVYGPCCQLPGVSSGCLPIAACTAAGGEQVDAGGGS